MIKALYSTLVEICDSKKALAVIATLISAAVAHLHWDVSPDAILPYLGLAAAYVVGQGIADHGKGAAEVIARAQALPPKPLAVVPKEAGFAAIQLLSVLAIVGLCAGFTLSNGCGAKTKAAEQAFIDCLEEGVKAEVPKLLPAVENILASGGSNWQAQLEALGIAYGKDALACTVSAAAIELGHKVGAGSATSPAAENAAAFIRSHGYVFRP